MRTLLWPICKKGLNKNKQNRILSGINPIKPLPSEVAGHDTSGAQSVKMLPNQFCC